jgi:hypothetical protein
MIIGRFPFTRKRQGVFIEGGWFFVRFYPPTLPRWTWRWKGRRARAVAAMPKCDCIASGNAAKPKQHGVDPHAKNCAVYIRR